MNVDELIALLRNVDPGSRVLFLDDYADLEETDEVREVIAPAAAWTHERGQCNGEEYSVRYPYPFEPRDDSCYHSVVHYTERVVLIANGPTNFRRLKYPELASSFLDTGARATAVEFHESTFVVNLNDGRQLRVPLYWFPALELATPMERASVRISRSGAALHWDELDEDISVEGLLRGHRDQTKRFK
jgi:hypothetical protein